MQKLAPITRGHDNYHHQCKLQMPTWSPDVGTLLVERGTNTAHTVTFALPTRMAVFYVRVERTLQQKKTNKSF
jgi:hypothetical protein